MLSLWWIPKLLMSKWIHYYRNSLIRFWYVYFWSVIVLVFENIFQIKFQVRNFFIGMWGFNKNDPTNRKNGNLCFQTLLEDPVVIVRASTIHGVCHIMSVYWELIPKAMIHTFILKLLQDLAWDAASADVRTAVLTVRVHCVIFYVIWWTSVWFFLHYIKKYSHLTIGRGISFLFAESICELARLF